MIGKTFRKQKRAVPPIQIFALPELFDERRRSVPNRDVVGVTNSDFDCLELDTISTTNA